MSITLKRISDTDSFRSLRDEWYKLYAQCAHATLFSSWEWLMTWWENFSDQYRRELCILAIYCNKELVGLAPFQIVTGHPLHLVTGRVLGFLGTIESDVDSIVGQYNDLITAPGYDDVVCDQVRQFLAENENDWNILDFQYLLQDALVLRCMHKNSAYSCKTNCNGYRFSVPQYNDLSEYTRSLTRRWRKMYAKKSRLLQRDGKVSVLESGRDITPASALELLTDMHGARWIKRIGMNKFRQRRFHQFHHDLLEKLVPQKRALIKILQLDDQPLAAYYAFRDKGQLHYYQSGFYAEFANRYSPLFLLVCDEIGGASEAGELFDFMYTEEVDCYKNQQYGASAEPMYRFICTHQSSRLKIYLLLRRLKKRYVIFCTNLKRKKGRIDKLLKSRLSGFGRGNTRTQNN